jgi:uncharacterized protein YebE (UPF0316 family)
VIKYIIGFGVACIVWILILSQIEMPEYRVYDCGMAEWHPDIPNEVKEECRKRRRLDWKSTNESTI